MKAYALGLGLTIAGALIGMQALVNMGHTYAQMPCDDVHAGNLYVAYAWPGQTTNDYSDPDVNRTSCDVAHP